MLLQKIFLLACILFPSATLAGSFESSVGHLRIDPIVKGLDTPWAFAFLPVGKVLITERDGRLLVFDGISVHKIKGLPRVFAEGQGGLLDVMVPRDFEKSREIFLTFAKSQGSGAGTALAAATLDLESRRLRNLRILFESKPSSSTGRHFGSRVIEARDGTLFMTLGDRGQAKTAQDLALHQGSIIRIDRDGTIPANNPFVGTAGAQAEIWSYGHRNPQGLAVDTRGSVWSVEHGAKGGDEINKLRKGGNFGWPVISYGTHYSGLKIGEGTQKTGMEQPEYYWDPSIAPSGMMIYSGKMWPKWKGDIFVGSLKFDYLSRLDGTPLQEREKLKSSETDRVRDVREGLDGAIWFLSVGNDTLYRVTPK